MNAELKKSVKNYAKVMACTDVKWLAKEIANAQKLTLEQINYTAVLIGRCDQLQVPVKCYGLVNYRRIFRGELSARAYMEFTGSRTCDFLSRMPVKAQEQLLDGKAIRVATVKDGKPTVVRKTLHDMTREEMNRTFTYDGKILGADAQMKIVKEQLAVETPPDWFIRDGKVVVTKLGEYDFLEIEKAYRASKKRKAA